MHEQCGSYHRSIFSVWWHLAFRYTGFVSLGKSKVLEDGVFDMVSTYLWPGPFPPVCGYTGEALLA